MHATKTQDASRGRGTPGQSERAAGRAARESCAGSKASTGHATSGGGPMSKSRESLGSVPARLRGAMFIGDRAPRRDSALVRGVAFNTGAQHTQQRGGGR
jgi:hypothetical protein